MEIIKVRFSWVLIVALVVGLVLPQFALADEKNGVNANSLVIAQVGEAFQAKAEPKKADVTNCTAYFAGTITVNNCRVGEVPKQAATWLFILALVAFVGLSNKRKV